MRRVLKETFVSSYFSTRFTTQYNSPPPHTHMAAPIPTCVYLGSVRADWFVRFEYAA